MPISTIIAVSAFCAAFLLLGYLSIYILKQKPCGLPYFKHRTRRK